MLYVFSSEAFKASKKHPKPGSPIHNPFKQHSIYIIVCRQQLRSRAVVLIEDIKEAWPSSQIKDIEDESGAVFEARGETAEDEADEVDETELPELSAEEVIRMGPPAVPTSWEPMAAVPELDLEVIKLLDELIFATRRTGKPISGVNADVKSDNFSN